MDNTVRLVGSIVDGNSLKVIGYILYVEKTGNITIIDARFLPSLLAMHDILNVIINDKGNVECTECSINNFPRYTVDDRGNINGCIDKNKMYVIGELVDDSNNVVGYRVMGASGKVLDISKDTISEQKCRNIDMVNVYVKGNTLIPNKTKKFSVIHTNKSNNNNNSNSKPDKHDQSDINNFGNKILAENKKAYLHSVAWQCGSYGRAFPFPNGSYYCNKTSYTIEEPGKKLAFKKMLSILRTEIRECCANDKEREHFDQQMKYLAEDIKSKNLETASIRISLMATVLYNVDEYKREFRFRGKEFKGLQRRIAEYFKFNVNSKLSDYATNLVVVSDLVFNILKKEYDVEHKIIFNSDEQKNCYNNIEMLNGNRIVRSRAIPGDIYVIKFADKHKLLPKEFFDKVNISKNEIESGTPVIISPRLWKLSDKTRTLKRIAKTNNLVDIIEDSINTYYSNSKCIIRKSGDPFKESGAICNINEVTDLKWEDVLQNYLSHKFYTNFTDSSKYREYVYDRIELLVKMMCIYDYDNTINLITRLENKLLKSKALDIETIDTQLLEKAKQSILTKDEIVDIQQNDLDVLEFYYKTNGGVQISEDGEFLDIAGFTPKIKI